MIKLLLCLAVLGTAPGCSDKDNKVTDKKEFPKLVERDGLYCSLSKSKYEAYGNTIEKECDAALFTSLHGLACDYVDPSVFEFEKSGRLCRRPGCSCYPKVEGQSSSDSNFSKDMATGMQLYYAAKPDVDLVKRVQDYGIDNKWTVCQGEDAVTTLSKCVMSPKIIYRWSEIEKKGAEQALEGLAEQPESDESGGIQVTGNTDFRAHLDILSILVEESLYSGVSDSSLETIKAQAEREPNNLLFQALLAKFVKGNETEVAELLLKKFPADRLPTTSDWCTGYLFQRDEFRGGDLNTDWLPCENRNEIHPGTDYLLASWVLQLGK